MFRLFAWFFVLVTIVIDTVTPSKITTVPCNVDIEYVAYNQSNHAVRNIIQLKDATSGTITTWDNYLSSTGHAIFTAQLTPNGGGVYMWMYPEHFIGLGPSFSGTSGNCSFGYSLTGTFALGDTNYDNLVNDADGNNIYNGLGTACNEPGYTRAADINLDCAINSTDKSLWNAANPTTGAPSFVPYNP